MNKIFSITNRVSSVYSETMGWRCDIIKDNGRDYLRFYNSDVNGDVRGPWMSLPVKGVEGKWSIGSREAFQTEVNKFLAAVSAALTANGIDHLG